FASFNGLRTRPAALHLSFFRELSRRATPFHCGTPQVARLQSSAYLVPTTHLGGAPSCVSPGVPFPPSRSWLSPRRSPSARRRRLPPLTTRPSVRPPPTTPRP